MSTDEILSLKSTFQLDGDQYSVIFDQLIKEGKHTYFGGVGMYRLMHGDTRGIGTSNFPKILAYAKLWAVSTYTKMGRK